MMDTNHFVVADYVVFGVIVGISFLLGIYYAFRGRHKMTTEEYLMAGRKVPCLPIALSMAVSFSSSIMILGVPAESFRYGIQATWKSVATVLVQVVAALTLASLIHPLKITSACQYLELRYKSRLVRTMGSCIQIISTLWYMGIVIFGPSIALRAVTGFPELGTILIVSVTCAVYTSLGGMKAVIWADVFQSSVMLAGMLAVVIKGTMDAGGVKEVWRRAENSGRFNFFNFDLDPTVRHTFWNLFVAALLERWGMTFDQGSIQRLAAARSVKESQRVMFVMAPVYFLFTVLSAAAGIIAFGYFDKTQCDPWASKQIKNSNQIIPYMVLNIFRQIPGLSGLFLAFIFSASLSTVSTGLASLSALTWEDFLKPCLKNTSELKATVIVKVLVLVHGILACVLSLLISNIGGPLTQLYYTFTAAFNSPLAGIFLLGALCRWANWKGAVGGGVVSMVMVAWISLGSSFSGVVKRAPGLPPGSTDLCTANVSLLHTYNFTSESPYHWGPNSTSGYDYSTELNPFHPPRMEGVNRMYLLSYRWFSPLGIFLVLIFGSIISISTGGLKQTVDSKYIVNVKEALCCCLSRRSSKVCKVQGRANKIGTDTQMMEML